jgi:RNA polymerase sigma factor (sigma-70 family)
VILEEVEIATEATPEALLLVDEAMHKLAREHPDKAELVKLRFYVGLSLEETAQTLGVSEKTVKRRWIRAWAWLFREVKQLMGGD